jgi:hypothetical protein
MCQAVSFDYADLMVAAPVKRDIVHSIPMTMRKFTSRG